MGTEGSELHGRVATLGSVHDKSVLPYLNIPTGIDTEGFELHGRLATLGSVHEISMCYPTWTSLLVSILKGLNSMDG